MCLGAGCGRVGSNRPLPPIEIYFSPHGGCTDAVVEQIDRAQNSILVQAYSFTSAPIAKALVEAHNRGVEIQVILDASQETEKYSSADFLVHAGIPTLVDHQHAIAHNKVMILDGATVITGSFNFTKAAEEHNAENLLVIRDAAIAEQYAANWQEHAMHSKPYERKAAAEPGDFRPASSKKGKAGARKGAALLP
jgi:phosphatidylserine/phosphatidylglycerophosphate/cardiolipin synthase-like enzyme